jgi:prephenate dehydratase
MATISIQGYKGSFHQAAALQFFGADTEVIPCATFREVVKIAADKKRSDGGVMAIENSIAGSIIPNYSLLFKSKLKIVGELFLQINQQLMVYPEISIHEIKEVHSHPMALLQCMDFLEQYPHWKLVESEDTALSAKIIAQKKSKHAAAIASALAADLYQLDIVAADIHTLKNNFTRFLILQRESAKVDTTTADKASVYFQTDHSRGSLAKVLSIIADGGINLSKLQSMPIPGSKFNYGFYADMEFDVQQQFDSVMKAISTIANSIKIFGIYKRGQ